MGNLHSPDDAVPSLRVHRRNSVATDPNGEFVLYWMTANRRCEWNFALDRAVAWANQFGKPLLILEGLQCDYPWASDRLHQFIIQGMADNSAALTDRQREVGYYGYVEPSPGAGRGLVQALAARACVVVADEFPCFFLPRIVSAVAQRAPVAFESVDSNGLLPLAATDRVFTVAHSFRRFLQKTLPDHLLDFPEPDPIACLQPGTTYQAPAEIVRRWPLVDPGRLLNGGDSRGLSELPIDHRVKTCGADGGASAAKQRLNLFLDNGWPVYGSERNHPESNAASELSAYLHFGHISAHQIFWNLMERCEWSPNDLADKPNGKREGWWNTESNAESFLDELITWREIGYNRCWLTDDYDQFESLPDWAIATLRAHEGDVRPAVYTLEEFEHAATHDELWNAAQRQLVIEGRIHNYLRMLWGKKILHWSKTPRDALAIMIELNNKYALDGRNPNSYSGIFWVLGRYDRAWGPERPVFGKVRYMTSDSTLKKLRLGDYLQRFGKDRRGDFS